MNLRVVLVLVVGGAAALALSAGGCAGGSSADHTARGQTRLTITSSPHWGLTTSSSQVHRYRLQCDPALGTVARPASVCRAIADYLRSDHKMHDCPRVQGRGALPWFKVTGTFRGSPVVVDLTANAWCSASKQIRRDLWLMSVFPRGLRVVTG